MSETADTTTLYRDSIIQMFLDGTTDEVYADGRMVTRRSEEGIVELIAYGWNKLAEYNERTDTVTVYSGHYGNISDTVDRYVELVSEIAGKRETRTVNTSDASPNVAEPPAASVRFINNYRSFDKSPSSVEEWATEQVERSVSALAASIL